ncbi:unnamed protein product [Protopolystoma xenopodis]|uniref:Uncharacterized protein n=1 Tax=Protopolystoma xenopodis TaxID=117903 RepID=A0A3S5CUD7_9PLAT|nr:unnamed protein product [Protopolystoma xenopodis]
MAGRLFAMHSEGEQMKFLAENIVFHSRIICEKIFNTQSMLWSRVQVRVDFEPSSSGTGQKYPTSTHLPSDSCGEAECASEKVGASGQPEAEHAIWKPVKSGVVESSSWKGWLPHQSHHRAGILVKLCLENIGQMVQFRIYPSRNSPTACPFICSSFGNLQLSRTLSEAKDRLCVWTCRHCSTDSISTMADGLRVRTRWSKTIGGAVRDRKMHPPALKLIP